MYKNGFLKVMTATPKIIAGDIKNNEQEILNVLNNTDASVVVFPELTLTGYTTSDLFYQERTLDEALDSLRLILKNNKHEGIAAIGIPLDIKGGLFNVAAIIQKNEVLGIVPKYFLPNNQEFQEKRWFLSGHEANFNVVKLFGKEVPFGSIIFIEEEKKVAIGVEICQDLWSIKTPADDLAMAGANIILNLSASTELINKDSIRRHAVLDHSRKQMAAYLYTTTGMFESSSEALFSSHKMIASLGEMVSESESVSFEADELIADINVTMINYRRRQDSNYRESIFKNEIKYHEVNFTLKENNNFYFSNKVNQKPFVPEKKELEKTYNILTASLIKKLSTLPVDSRKIILGLSGGLDSAHALIIAYNAFKMMNLPLADLYAVILPAHASTSKSMLDAEELAKGLGLEPLVINIEESVNKHLKEINHDTKDVTFENAQARMRTLVLMDLANKYKGIVLGTGDLSEIALGFMTYNGDQMSMYGINSGLPKTLIQALITYYSNNKYKHIKDVLTRIVEKKISPELLDGQESEAMIGTYLINDFIMHYHLNSGLDEPKLIWLVEKVFTLSNSEATTYVNRFIKRFYSQQFKRTTMPEGPKLFDLSLSPRISYRMPSDIVRK
ncbi:NAD(+) synthase [Haploplasma axanthum]|nr:NAD(+) synthase [Haploplasma axanthum]